MEIDANILLLVLILFCSTLIRSTFGFGDALVAMPLLAMLLGIRIATPLVAMVASSIALTILIKNWRSVYIHSAWKLIVSTMIGIPLGLFYLKGSQENLMKLILAFVIISYSVYSLIKPKLLHLQNDKWAFLFGIIAGILGGAYNTNGPVVVLYGNLRKWAPEAFRATLQGYFLPTGLVIILGHLYSGLWTRYVIQSYILALPAVLLAIFLGTRLNQTISKDKFESYIYLLLVAIGVFMLIQTF